MDYRQRIIAAFKELSMLRGFSGVTVDDLAAHTGISKRTIYRYFNSKEEIIISVLEDFMSTVRQKVQQALDSSADPAQRINNVVMVVAQNVRLFHPLALHDLQKFYPHLWEKIEQFRAERIQEVIENVLAGEQESYFQKINPKIFSTALLTSIRAVVNPAFIMENNLSPEETIQSLFKIFFYGILDEK